MIQIMINISLIFTGVLIPLYAVKAFKLILDSEINIMTPTLFCILSWSIVLAMKVIGGF